MSSCPGPIMGILANPPKAPTKKPSLVKRVNDPPLNRSEINRGIFGGIATMIQICNLPLPSLHRSHLMGQGTQRHDRDPFLCHGLHQNTKKTKQNMDNMQLRFRDGHRATQILQQTASLIHFLFSNKIKKENERNNALISFLMPGFVAKFLAKSCFRPTWPWQISTTIQLPTKTRGKPIKLA